MVGSDPLTTDPLTIETIMFNVIGSDPLTIEIIMFNMIGSDPQIAD